MCFTILSIWKSTFLNSAIDDGEIHVHTDFHIEIRKFYWHAITSIFGESDLNHVFHGSLTSNFY